jgi:hypothetical protein
LDPNLKPSVPPIQLPPPAGGPRSVAPLPQVAAELQAAFDELNKRLGLFINPTMIRISRERPAFAWFVPNAVTRYDGADTVHEINLNDSYLPARSLLDTLASLGAVMVEAYWFDRDRAVRHGYHHRYWAHKMEKIGLMPTSTGQPGGAVVGRRMSQYVIPDGRFERACKDLLKAGFLVSWFSRYAAARPVGMSMPPVTLDPGPSATPMCLPANAESVDAENDAMRRARNALLEPIAAEIPEERFRGAVKKIVWAPPPRGTAQAKYSCACPVQRHVWGKKGLRGIWCQVCNSEFVEDSSKKAYGVRRAVP